MRRLELQKAEDEDCMRTHMHTFDVKVSLLTSPSLHAGNTPTHVPKELDTHSPKFLCQPYLTYIHAGIISDHTQKLYVYIYNIIYIQVCVCVFIHTHTHTPTYVPMHTYIKA